MSQKPFLKWVGGKTQILSSILSRFPTTIHNYYEPFLGGGSVLLGVLSSNLITITGKVYAYDANLSLIWVFKHIQSSPSELWTFIELYIKKYDSITGVEINRKPDGENSAMGSKESYYYWLRGRFNQLDKTSLECAAIFMILNKTCFRGMYREGPNGFNVPFGHYKTTPTIITKSMLDTISVLIKDVVFECKDFRESLGEIPGIEVVVNGDNVKNGEDNKVVDGKVVDGKVMDWEDIDFVYLDPPYAPISTTSFVGYTKGGFSLEMHQDLFKLIKRLDKKSVKWLMSNAKTELVKNAFIEYTCEEIVARRAIHCKKPGTKVMEVMIRNY